jgi:hypothetical protein
MFVFIIARARAWSMGTIKKNLPSFRETLKINKKPIFLCYVQSYGPWATAPKLQNQFWRKLVWQNYIKFLRTVKIFLHLKNNFTEEHETVYRFFKKVYTGISIIHMYSLPHASFIHSDLFYLSFKAVNKALRGLYLLTFWQILIDSFVQKVHNYRLMCTLSYLRKPLSD